MLSFDRVMPQVFVGTAPAVPADVRRLRRSLGITAVLNLQTDADFDHWHIDWPAVAAAYETDGLVIERWPIRDFDADDLLARTAGAVERLDNLLEVGHRVYLHCTAGQQRSPAIAIAYLVSKRDYRLREAVDEVTSQRVCAPDIATLERLFANRRDAADQSTPDNGSTS